jgi:myo-inositol-1(or 4)-monophosphatase
MGMTLNLSASLDAAQQIARRAGAVVREAYYQPRNVRYKGNIDLVTQADEEAERLIVVALREAFPDHAILAEEGGETDGTSNYTWLVDPLDGTTNFAHGFPVFAVSIALRGPDGSLLLGVIYDPLRDECFAGAQGQGVTLNGEVVRATGEVELRRSLLATGFAYDRHTAPDNNTAAFARFIRRAQGVRRAGAAALDLAYVACGRLDGFWERALHAWDVAAGILLVREAGGTVTNYTGGEEGLYEGHYIVASNGHVHDAMLAVLADQHNSTGDTNGL